MLAYSNDVHAFIGIADAGLLIAQNVQFPATSAPFLQGRAAWDIPHTRSAVFEPAIFSRGMKDTVLIQILSACEDATRCAQ